MIKNVAYYLGRNDDEPNIELAIKLCEANDKNGIKEIVDGLQDKISQVANDCIKVIYEIGERNPDLIADYAEIFLSLLQSKNNRLIWGCMIALSTIADIKADVIFTNLDVIKSAYEKGSVITIDNSISVLAKVCKANEAYEKEVFPLLLKHLSTLQSRGLISRIGKYPLRPSNYSIDTSPS